MKSDYRMLAIVCFVVASALLPIAQCTRAPGCAGADLSCNEFALWLYVVCEPLLISGGIQGCPLDLTGEVSTFAGSGAAALTDGIGTAAAFNTTNGSTADQNSIYLADATNSAIRKIDIATGAVTTVATGFGGVVRDVVSDGVYLYVAASAATRIERIEIATGARSILAGSGVSGTVDGTGTAAQFTFPHGITLANGFLYVAQTDHVIRRIDLATTQVITYAGSPGGGGYNDGPLATSLLSEPLGLVAIGNALYISEIGNNHTIRKIDLIAGQISTIAGVQGVAGAQDGFGTNATFNDPYSLTSDGHNLYVSEWNGQVIRKVELATGRVIRLAGQPGVTGSSDGVFDQALFNQPRGLTSDGVSLYISDSLNNTLRRLR